MVRFDLSPPLVQQLDPPGGAWSPRAGSAAQASKSSTRGLDRSRLALSTTSTAPNRAHSRAASVDLTPLSISFENASR